jgi:hypothetical protein
MCDFSKVSSHLKQQLFYTVFLTVFFTQEGTLLSLRFYLFYTLMIPAAPQETVGEAGIEPGTAV